MERTKTPLIKDSTKAFFVEGKETEDYSFYDFLHGYLYAKWPYLYIGVGIGEHRLSKILEPIFMFLSGILENRKETQAEDPGYAWANAYHGKVVPMEEAKRLVTIQEDVTIRDLEHVIPYNRAKDIVLKNPEKIVALVCPCRAARPEPCTPLDVCLIIGDPFVSFVLEHQPEKARQISPEEAMAILEEEHQRGHVHHAFFKDAMLQRFYAICNCCSCCCGAFQAQRNGSPMLMYSGYTASVQTEKCEGCQSCVELISASLKPSLSGEILPRGNHLRSIN